MAKQIIISHEKHGTYYFNAETPEAWAKSALSILTERWKQGYWYDDPNDDGLGNSELADKRREEYRRALALTDDEINELPEEAQKSIRYLRAQAKQDSEYDQKHRVWYEAAKKVVEDQDLDFFVLGDRTKARTKAGKEGRYERKVPKAWVLLEERSDHEYERVELEDLRDGTLE